jgi:hypothetical protein
MREAFLMYERGDATVRVPLFPSYRLKITPVQAEDIDTAMKFGAGHRECISI